MNGYTATRSVPVAKVDRARAVLAVCTALIAMLWLAAGSALGAHPGTNGRIAFQGLGSHGLHTIKTINPDGSGLAEHLDADRSPPSTWDWYAAFDSFTFSFSPDGESLAFNATPGGDHPLGPLSCGDESLWLLTLDDNAISPLVPECPPPYWTPRNMSWSPDGATIVLDNAQSAGELRGLSQVTLLDVATGTLTPLVSWQTVSDPACPLTEEQVGGASWSPLGDRIAFVRTSIPECPGIDGIWTIRPDGTDLTKVAGGKYAAPDWSPDGASIVFVEDDGGGDAWNSVHGSIWVVDAEGGTPTLLRAGFSMRPVWSPDGSKIAFRATGGVYVMDADGDNVSLVPNTADAIGNGLAWQRVVPPPAEDADSDGVVDSIDSGDAAFDDGSGTSGSIADAAGLDVLVSDADDAGDGVKITVGAGGGRATFSVCGFTVRVSAGSEVVITCSSVTVEVVEGAAEVEFGGVVVAVPEGGKAKVSDLGGTVFRIENQGATSVAVTAAGQETTLAPGEEISLSTDTDPDADAGGPYQAVEGSSVQLTGSASGGTAPYDFLWSSIGSLSDPFVAAPTIDAVDDGTLPLSLTVTDANGSTGSDDTELTVTNADPELGSLQLPSASVPTGTPVSAQAAFTDAGLADTHTATIDWGDGSPVDAATVTGADGSGTASAGHTYTTPATYTVTLTVRDDDGGQDQVSAQVTVLGGVPVELTKTASKAQVAVGTSVRYTLTITNPGSATVTVTALADDRPLPGACTDLVGRTILAGGSRKCTYNATLTSVGQAINTASVSVRNAQSQTGSDSATATVTVTKASAKLTTTSLPTSGPLGTNLKNTATLTGGYQPTGTVTFRLYSPSQTACTGTPQHTETVSVNGAGTYTTPTGYAANARGTWRWTVEYSGDANNNPGTTPCNGARVRIA